MTEWTEWKPAEGSEDLEQILYEKRYRKQGGGVARVTMNRMERMNSITDRGFREISAAFGDAARDNSIGVAVYSHNGPHFGVGGDMQWELESGLQQKTGGAGADIDVAIRNCPKPVIAAVRGYAIGNHHHNAYSCDLTIAGESAIFGQAGNKTGAGPGGWLVAYAATVMGAKHGRDLWLRHPQFTAQEAEHIGLCNVVVQDRLVDNEVEKWCDQILDLIPWGLANSKMSYNAADMAGHFANHFRSYLNPRYNDGPEFHEAQHAFFEKRPPNFWTDEMIKGREM